MIWFTLLIGIGLVFFFKNKGHNEVGALGDFFATVCIGGFLAVILNLVIGCIILANFEMTPTVVKQYEISAIQDTKNSQGNFFIGTGKINEELYYYIPIKYPDGTMVKKFKISEIFINEGNEYSPNIQVIESKYPEEFTKYAWLYSIIAPYGDKYNQKYKVYVPEGSISNDFSVDLK